MGRAISTVCIFITGLFWAICFGLMGEQFRQESSLEPVYTTPNNPKYGFAPRVGNTTRRGSEPASRDPDSEGDRGKGEITRF